MMMAHTIVGRPQRYVNCNTLGSTERRKNQEYLILYDFYLIMRRPRHHYNYNLRGRMYHRRI